MGLPIKSREKGHNRRKKTRNGGRRHEGFLEYSPLDQSIDFWIGAGLAAFDNRELFY